jgi:ribonuclease HII
MDGKDSHMASALLACAKEERDRIYEMEQKMKRVREDQGDGYVSPKTLRAASPYQYSNVYLPMLNRMTQDEIDAYLRSLSREPFSKTTM